MAQINCQDDFVVIKRFMLTELELKGNELLIYAVIYGFSKDGVHRFHGSRQYLADWTNIALANVQKNLNSLVEKELIIKYEVYKDNVKYCEYSANLDRLKTLQGVTQNITGVGMNHSGGRNEMSHNNIDNNINNNIDNNIYSAFEKTILELYKGKKSKSTRDKKVPKLLKKYGVEQLTRCLERYAKECRGREKQFIMMESTFWNGRYADYLDCNYEENYTQPQNKKKSRYEDF